VLSKEICQRCQKDDFKKYNWYVLNSVECSKIGVSVHIHADVPDQCPFQLEHVLKRHKWSNVDAWAVEQGCAILFYFCIFGSLIGSAIFAIVALIVSKNN